MQKFITLAYDYTLNGMVKWTAGAAHEATDELRQLLDDGVEGVEHAGEVIAQAIEGESADAAPATGDTPPAEGTPEAQ